MNAVAEFDSFTHRMNQWSHASAEVVTQFISEIPETIHDFAEKSFKKAHEYLAWLRGNQVLEQAQAKDNLRVARGGRAMSLLDQPIRPEPQSVGGRLLRIFSGGSTPAPE